MTAGIYKLYFEGRDEFYIGSSSNIERRYKEHVYNLKKNQHVNAHMQSIFSKYGKPPRLKILEKHPNHNRKELYEIEQRYFDKLNAIEDDKCMNMQEVNELPNVEKIQNPLVYEAILRDFFENNLKVTEIAKKYPIGSSSIYRLLKKETYPQYNKIYQKYFSGDSTSLFQTRARLVDVPLLFHYAVFARKSGKAYEQIAEDVGYDSKTVRLSLKGETSSEESEALLRIYDI